MTAHPPYLNDFYYNNNNSNNYQSPNNINNRFATTGSKGESRMTQLFSPSYCQYSTPQHGMTSPCEQYVSDTSNDMFQYHRQLSTTPFFYPPRLLYNQSQQPNLVSCTIPNTTRMPVRLAHQTSLTDCTSNNTNNSVINLSKKRLEPTAEFVYWNTNEITVKQQQSSKKNGELIFLPTQIKKESCEPIVYDSSKEELVLNGREIIKNDSKNRVKIESLDANGIAKQPQQQQQITRKETRDNLENLSNCQKIIQQEEEQTERSSSISMLMNNESKQRQKQDHLIRKIPVSSEDKRRCAVCSDIASGYHYGVWSCEGCKAFFKRSIQGVNEYICPATNTCTIDKHRRKSCQACRLRRCYEVGMTKGTTRRERRYKRKAVSVCKISSTSSTPNNTANAQEPQVPQSSALMAQPQKQILQESRINSSAEFITILSQASRLNLPAKIDLTIQLDDKYFLQLLAKIFDQELVVLINWAKTVPGYTESLTLDQQVTIIEQSWLDTLLLGIIERSVEHSDDSLHFAPDFTIPRTRELNSPTLQCICSNLFNLVQAFKEPRTTHEEFIALKATILINSVPSTISSTKALRTLTNQVYQSIQYASDSNPHIYNENYIRHFFLLLQLPHIKLLSSRLIRLFLDMRILNMLPQADLLLEMLDAQEMIDINNLSLINNNNSGGERCSSQQSFSNTSPNQLDNFKLNTQMSSYSESISSFSEQQQQDVADIKTNDIDDEEDCNVIQMNRNNSSNQLSSSQMMLNASRNDYSHSLPSLNIQTQGSFQTATSSSSNPLAMIYPPQPRSTPISAASFSSTSSYHYFDQNTNRLSSPQDIIYDATTITQQSSAPLQQIRKAAKSYKRQRHEDNSEF
ncbi:unnamed protein product [Didymodactylos carnosus]|uniref:Estrogen receptor n=1 Tax=Didymodactylos carnosus TaxID=1234261 RepID=A0A813YIG1_9BILA|nr:unnamed protein product [Didymodactylos carnosus]CAF0884844.1 unnamed protein product [Didymodactylos carnosus]CAF3512643.1 unnamed protein product [Didymodactylos carnosus]CAF3670299.1 unnamed protein product [Didymodactylos carnosus]